MMVIVSAIKMSVCWSEATNVKPVGSSKKRSPFRHFDDVDDVDKTAEAPSNDFEPFFVYQRIELVCCASSLAR
jgi:hypothetical protein